MFDGLEIGCFDVNDVNVRCGDVIDFSYFDEDEELIECNGIVEFDYENYCFGVLPSDKVNEILPIKDLEFIEVITNCDDNELHELEDLTENSFDSDLDSDEIYQRLEELEERVSLLECEDGEDINDKISELEERINNLDDIIDEYSIECIDDDINKLQDDLSDLETRILNLESDVVQLI